MKIAICDDEKIFCEEARILTEKILDKCDIDYKITVYNSGEEFLGKIEDTDIVLLDIEMDGMDGFQVAEYLCEKYPNVFVIFLTSHEEQIRRAFRVKAYRFLDKPVNESELKEALLNAIDEMRNIKMLKVKNAREICKVRYRDIVYIEALGEGCVIYTLKGHIISKNSLASYFSELKGAGFIDLSREYIVSLNYVDYIKDGKIFLENKKEIEIPRRKQKMCETLFAEYIKKNSL